jgi:hypothetical protein
MRFYMVEHPVGIHQSEAGLNRGNHMFDKAPMFLLF